MIRQGCVAAGSVSTSNDVGRWRTTGPGGHQRPTRRPERRTPALAGDMNWPPHGGNGGQKGRCSTRQQYETTPLSTGGALDICELRLRSPRPGTVVAPDSATTPSAASEPHRALPLKVGPAAPPSPPSRARWQLTAGAGPTSGSKCAERRARRPSNNGSGCAQVRQCGPAGQGPYWSMTAAVRTAAVTAGYRSSTPVPSDGTTRTTRKSRRCASANAVEVGHSSGHLRPIGDARLGFRTSRRALSGIYGAGL